MKWVKGWSAFTGLNVQVNQESLYLLSKTSLGESESQSEPIKHRRWGVLRK